MNIRKIIIVMGLSGSEKTTYLNKNYKNYIKFESFKHLKDIIRNFNDSELILDSLFLKNEDIIQILYTFSQVYCEETIDVEIIYLKPNIKYCLWNNITKIEYPNIDLMKFLIDCFMINPNINLPQEIEENDLFWFKLIEKDKNNIKYVPEYLKQDLLDLYNKI